MKVFITGATGFVGAHTTRVLLEAGYQVRLLVRRPQAARDYFARHGHAVDDLVVGDMRDASSMVAAMAGCDAVVHAAADVCLDPNKAEATYRNNVDGMNAVIGTACTLGIERIVYVSSLSVLFRPGAEVLNEQSPLADSSDAYSRSKRDADALVRDMQAQGLPVQITYPAGIIGPDDPKLSEVNRALSLFVCKILPRTSTGMQFVDVRDLADAHRRMLEAQPPANYRDARYIVGGRYYPWDDLYRQLASLTGQRVFSPRIPGALFRLAGSVTEQIRKIVPFNTDIGSEEMAYITQWTPADSSRLENTFGLQFRSPEQTFGDTIAWMIEAGHLDQKYAVTPSPAQPVR